MGMHMGIHMGMLSPLRYAASIVYVHVCNFTGPRSECWTWPLFLELLHYVGGTQPDKEVHHQGVGHGTQVEQGAMHGTEGMHGIEDVQIVFVGPEVPLQLDDTWV